MSASASSSPSSVSPARSFTHLKESSSYIVRERRMVIGSLLLTAVATVSWHSQQLPNVMTRDLQHVSSSRNLQHSHNYMDLVKTTYNQTFAHLNLCPDNMHMDKCLAETWNRLDDNDDIPWWFQTMLRDAPSQVMRTHHHLSAPLPSNKHGIHFCTIGKIGTTQWRKVMCHLQDKPHDNGRAICLPKRRISPLAPQVVFLRDPLERFLSAYLDKCLRKPFEQHCEPRAIFYEKENGLTEGLDKSKKLLFETYVETMPLKWNMHFVPQRYVRIVCSMVALQSYFIVLTLFLHDKKSLL